MTSEEEERPRFVTGGYGRHRRQWINEYGKHMRDVLGGCYYLTLLAFFKGRFFKTIILLAFVGYEMGIANLVLCVSLAIYHLISNARSWNDCYLLYGSVPQGLGTTNSRI